MIAAVAAVLLTVTVFALADKTAVQTFESNLLKSVKKKFQAYNDAVGQDRIYLQTDKSFYKPGETVWLSAYVRDAKTLKPSAYSDIIHLEFINPKGNTELHYKLLAKDGIAQGDIDLKDHLGGIYKIKAYTAYQKNEEDPYYIEKEITLQTVVMPRLKMKLDYEKKAYGKGDEVSAKLNLNTNENKPLGNKVVKYTAMLDGKAIQQSTVTTDDSGRAVVKCTLPKDLKTADGMINVLIDFEGSTEAISRSIPIVLNQIKLDLFPEGADLVAGVRGRVAFRAVNEFGKAADIVGQILDEKDKVITQFSSLHMGMGAFDMIAEKGHSYHAKITKPEGITDTYNLPEALDNGYTLRADAGRGSIEAKVYSFQNEQLTLVAQTRGQLCYSGSFNAVKGDNLVRIPTADFPIGISQITLFDKDGVARAERLIFVNKGKQLKVTINTDKTTYQPRERVNMNIRVTDQNGLPVSGNFGLAVVDDNLLTYADDKQGNILSKMLLEPELKEKVEEPNFYFDAKEAKADQALDYLLLTSGWRRYTWKKIMSGEVPAVSQQGEKVVFSGTILQPRSNKPVAGATVKLLPIGKVVRTDSAGRYDLGWFDISVNNKLEISADGYGMVTNTIMNYGRNMNYFLYPPFNPVYMARGGNVPKAAPMRGGVKREKEVVLEDDANIMVEGAAMGRAEQMDKGRALIINGGREDEVQHIVNGRKVIGKADEAPVPIEEKQKEEVADNFRADIKDLREAKIRQNDREAVQPDEAVFYRAKEFPKKNYTKNDTSRNDFATTLYWNGNVETDRSGRAKVSFVTNDMISSFKATIEGFGDNGAIGRGEYNFATNLPFSMDVKLPSVLVSGDKVSVPVFLKNNTTEPIKGALSVNNIPSLKMTSSLSSEVVIQPRETKVVYVSYEAAHVDSDYSWSVSFRGGSVHDQIVRPVRVIAKGFPATVSLSGQDVNKDFTINPTNVVPGSMQVSFTAYPNIMTELMSGIDAILREPYGCFEQTSSSNYPNIMALSYLKGMGIKDPALEKKATDLLDKGYKKLVSFETKENGYEWFGAAPAHEALTAYGLMEFEDMKKVYPQVDQAMIDRTAQKILLARDGNGGFKRNPRRLDSFGGADDDITNAYIVYALSEAGYKDIQKELEASTKEAKRSKDPYLMALIANALYNVGDQKQGDEMIKEIVKEKNQFGFWTGKKHSITRSTGEALNIETTSLIALAAMKSTNPDNGTIITATKYLVGARSGFGGFGSTQSTVLALKALTKYAEYSKKTDEDGQVEIYQNGQLIATKAYKKGDKGSIVIKDLEKKIGEGTQHISVQFKGCKNPLPYSMNVSYSTTLPQSSAACVLDLDTKITGAKTVRVGETLRLSTTLRNTKDKGQPMSMAIIGIPAGFTPQPWQLKEMMEKKVFDFYEVIDNNVVCYYREMAPGDVKQINLDLKAEVPGEYQAPASSAYLYYTNEHKIWKSMDRVYVNP
jgi:hypothetical protein